MRRPYPTGRLLPALCWMVAAAALCTCSLILDFDPAGLPCDVAHGQACLSGYTCNNPNPNVFICIADDSLDVGAHCAFDRQCAGDAICPSGVGQCVAPCPVSQAYIAGSPNCSSGTYCRPVMSTGMFSDGQIHSAQLVTGCAPTDNCTYGSACDSNLVQGGTCANMNNNATACVPGCEITFTTTTYRDNCGADASGNPRFCQALGPGPGFDVLACLDGGPTPQPVGSPCGNPVAQPCGPGAGCINNVCRAYTNLSTNVNNCPAGLQPCDLHVNANTLVGYCSNDASCTH